MPSDLTAWRALDAIARRCPDKAAIVCGSEDITFSDLIRRIDGMAERLNATGIGYQDAFAVYSQNRPEFMVCYFAASKIGAVFVPINPNMTPSEAGYAASHSEAKILFHDDACAKIAGDTLPRTMCRPIADISGAPSGPVGEEPRIGVHDDFLIIYTSGSTGTPKAVVLDHAAQAGAAASLRELWDLSESDTVLVALPLGYLYGLSTAAAVGLQAGARVVVLPRFHPGEVLEAFVAHRATVFQGVPTMFAMMLEYVNQRDLDFDLSHVRALICAGSPLSPELKARFAKKFGKGVWDYYAMTEATPVFSVFASDSESVPRGAIGKLAPGAEARIVDADNRDVAANVHAELLVRAPATMKRYHKDPALTRSSMLDGWFRTGDVGFRDEVGYYYITGRIKDVIIRGGANIAPSEVEAVIARHSAVQDVAIVGAPDRVFGEVPVAYVVKRHGADVAAEQLIAFAEVELAEFKVPRQIIFLAELPLGKTGKVDKTALKRRQQDDS